MPPALRKSGGGPDGAASDAGSDGGGSSIHPAPQAERGPPPPMQGQGESTELPGWTGRRPMLIGMDAASRPSHQLTELLSLNDAQTSAPVATAAAMAVATAAPRAAAAVRLFLEWMTWLA